METFYNRIQETEKMVNMVKNGTSSNKIIVISGKTGIGKSAFVDKVLSNELQNFMSIRVNICKASVDTIDNLFYINALYRTLSNLSRKKPFDKVHSPLYRGVTNIQNVLSFAVDIALDKTLGDGNLIFEHTDERSVLRKKDYIISVLEKNSCIIAIDNIQSIDTQSLEILKDVVEKIDDTTFIFEYTTNNESMSDDILAFYNTLKKFNATVYLFEMKCLDFQEAKKLAPSNIDETQLQQIYQISEGNLVKMQLADSTLGLNENPIKFRLSQLSKDKFFLVNILYLNGAIISYTDLCKMLVGNLNAPPFSEQKISRCINELENEKIIRYTSFGEVRLYHDSVISQLNLQSASAPLYSAYSVLKEYYCQKLCESKDEESIEHLFCLYLHFSDEELITLFPQISNLLKNYKYPQTVINKLVLYREKIQSQKHLNHHLYKKLVEFLVNLCIEYGLYDEAINNLNLIYSPANPYHRALKSRALSINFTNKKSIDLIRQLINQASSPREKLTSELCLLSAEMALQPRQKSLDMAKKMIETLEYQDCLEYAFLLSNYAELVDDSDECLSLYEQAIKRFHYAGRNDYVSNILVFVSMIYAYQGKTSNARQALDISKKRGGVKESYLLNNYAVLDVIEENATEKDVKQLSDALLLTCDPYEKILIQCNLLVCYTILAETERAEQIMLEITRQSYEQFQYEEFLHIVYQDLIFYFNSSKQESKAEQYRQQLRNLMKKSSSNTMLINIAKNQMNSQSTQNFFYSKFPFRVDFLGSWNVEVSPDLENY